MFGLSRSYIRAKEKNIITDFMRPQRVTRGGGGRLCCKSASEGSRVRSMGRGQESAPH